MSMAKITIDDIAKKVKVSKSTVSRYLNVEVKYLHVDFMEWKKRSCLKAKLKEQ